MEKYDFIKSEDDKSIVMWTDNGLIKPDKIIISDIERNESLENDIESGLYSEEIAKEMIPDGIESIELERVK